MQKAVNRFWDWMFHPSIRAYSNPNLKASVFRYPSPGNHTKPQLNGDPYTDYKTPYEHSHYNVRYTKPTQAQTANVQYEYKLAPLTLSSIQILKKVGLLKEGQENNVDLVSEAKKKFQQKYKYSVDSRIYKNDGEQNFLTSTNPAEISAYLQSFYQNLSQSKVNGYDYSMNRKTIDDPQMVPLQSVDIFVTPHFQQARIDNEYLIEQEINQNVKKGYIDAHIGDAKFWKTIDDSFDSHEVQKVQKHLKDPTPTDFNMRKTKIDLQIGSAGNVLDVHPKH